MPRFTVITLLSLVTVNATFAAECTAQFKKGTTPEWILQNHSYGVDYTWEGRFFDEKGQVQYVGPRHITRPESTLTNFSPACKSLKQYQFD